MYAGTQMRGMAERKSQASKRANDARGRACVRAMADKWGRARVRAMAHKWGLPRPGNEGMFKEPAP